MTMRITKNQLIGGVPAKDVRDILRKLHIESSFTIRWMEDRLFNLWRKRVLGNARGSSWWPETEAEAKRIIRDMPHLKETINAAYRNRIECRRDAARLVSTLLADAFVRLDERGQNDGTPRYELAEAGEELCRATAAKPLHRQKVEEVLKGLIERVGIVNADDKRFLYRVTAVVLFGSYVRGAERLGDADLGIAIERKIKDKDEYEKARKDYLGSRNIDFINGLFAPQRDVLTFLKQRKRTLSLHEMSELRRMAENNPDRLGKYEVLFGDQDQIAQDLNRPTEK